MKMVHQQYCLRWKHHHTNVQNMFAQLLEKERFCDVTLYCSPSFATQVTNKDTVDPQNIHGVSLRAHRVVLAACSELLGALLGAHEAHGEPVLVIDGAEPKHLRALLDYMYTGEMNVHHSQLASLLKTAEELRIKGLTNVRWNNKDEPPDYEPGAAIVTTATPSDPKFEQPEPKSKLSPKRLSPKPPSPQQMSPKQPSPRPDLDRVKREESDTDIRPVEKLSVNGGPPPLIKLPIREKFSPSKRDNSDTESPSPKRQRLTSGTENTDDETVLPVNKVERDQDWQHGNLDISAERVAGWEGGERSGSDEEWGDAPADIGSFLHTRLQVDGDNSADEESNESVKISTPRTDAPPPPQQTQVYKQTVGPKSGPTDPRFTDVVKLSDYLQHGRRPQFWEENYVKRVMEAVRMKELEMKQAAEILGVSYGTLYGRYRDVYGCINRPYSQGPQPRDRHVPSIDMSGDLCRGVRDLWQAKGPCEVLEQLQRGELSLESAARALGVSIANLAAHVADFGLPENACAEFESIPIEVDPSLKMRPRTYSSGSTSAATLKRKTTILDKVAKKVLVGCVNDEDSIPATVISTSDTRPLSATAKWPTIRVASLDSLRGDPPAPPSSASSTPAPPPTSPSALMRTRPDLTIVAARKPDRKDEEP